MSRPLYFKDASYKRAVGSVMAPFEALTHHSMQCGKSCWLSQDCQCIHYIKSFGYFAVLYDIEIRVRVNL